MLSQLLFTLFFETIEPSYSTFVDFFPSNIFISASAPTLNSPKTPLKKGESIAPVIEAQSVYSIDLESGAPLFMRDIFTRRPIASIAKLMTAMVILDNHSLNEKIKVSKNATKQEGSRMWLAAGEAISVENVLTGLLINSANDAAVALAEFDAGSEENFVRKLNMKAVALGLKNTSFSNAKGFDADGNYSTAYDTIIFSRAALDYPFIRKITAIKKGGVTSLNGKMKHALESTNDLLENPYFKIIGLKTGHTPASGESFVSLAAGPNGREILTVMLNSPDRFKETKILLDWIFRNFDF